MATMNNTNRTWAQWRYFAAWRTVMIAAAIAVLVDHRSAIRDLNIDIDAVWGRWMTYSRLAERLATESVTPAAYRIPKMRRIVDV
jgi:hypothetical protein